jgi:predicted metal-dependent hydrolase
VRPDGSARITIPRGGSQAQARRFAQRHVNWLEKQLLRQAARASESRTWRVGTELLLRGAPARIETGIREGAWAVRLGSEEIHAPDVTADLRPVIEAHLRELAVRELPERVSELAAAHQCVVGRVRVGNQRSRWGSCSRRATISLNWRLVQTPAFVSDYLILHELMHLRHMNHSRRFWKEVARVCPGWVEAERWLKKNANLLR